MSLHQKINADMGIGRRVKLLLKSAIQMHGSVGNRLICLRWQHAPHILVRIITLNTASRCIDVDVCANVHISASRKTELESGRLESCAREGTMSRIRHIVR
jgi:hypothetical protein